MTDSSFQVLKSNKVGLNSPESYVVTRGTTSYLRLLGAEPQWELMTATASEDRGQIKVCSSQLRLIESALRLGVELATRPLVETDRLGREYVKICVINQKEDQNDKDFNNELSNLLSRFFEIYDSSTDVKSRERDEMIDLYHNLSDGHPGGEVYLSDGVWLGSDGSLHDRGR